MAKPERCSCETCAGLCPNEIKSGWHKCRPCALNWHQREACENPAQERLWPLVSTCALCGYELTVDGRSHRAGGKGKA